MEPFFIATPEKSYSTLLVVLFLTIAFFLFVLLVQTNKIPKIRGAYKQVSVLLGSLLTLMFFATTLLTTWNLYRVQPIRFFDDYIECYQGKIPYKQITRAGIYTDQQKSIVNPEIALNQNKMLVLEQRGRQAAIFSEDYYDVELLVRKIRGKMGEIIEN